VRNIHCADLVAFIYFAIWVEVKRVKKNQQMIFKVVFVELLRKALSYSAEERVLPSITDALVAHADS